MRNYIVTIATTTPRRAYLVTADTVIVAAESAADAVAKINGPVEKIGWSQAVAARPCGEVAKENQVGQAQIDKIKAALAIREKQRVSCRAANAARRERIATEGGK